tara:strand:- start:2669 stop:3166 length:498 start_codon:yes stop_codon:yes gene_type:complete
MPDKITYEEALIEKTAKKMKEVQQLLNENDLWSGKTPHNTPMHDTKGDGDIQKVTRPKAENVSEKNPVGGVISKAPITNPRRDRHSAKQSNDDLTMEEYDTLFREKVDPIIESMEAKGESYAYIEAEELNMSPLRALEVAKELYKDKGFSGIFIYNHSQLNFSLG